MHICSSPAIRHRHDIIWAYITPAIEVHTVAFIDAAMLDGDFITPSAVRRRHYVPPAATSAVPPDTIPPPPLVVAATRRYVCL